MSTFALTFLLLIIYQEKHWWADFPLQGHYMLGKFNKGWDWVLPLTAHATVHGAFTLAIALAFTSFNLKFSLGLALFDMVIHFTMDRIKASPNLLGRYKALSASEMMTIKENFAHYKADPHSPTTMSGQPIDMAKLRSNTLFWWFLGQDQKTHHYTHYAIIYMLVRYHS